MGHSAGDAEVGDAEPGGHHPGGSAEHGGDGDAVSYGEVAVQRQDASSRPRPRSRAGDQEGSKCAGAGHGNGQTPGIACFPAWKSAIRTRRQVRPVVEDHSGDAAHRSPLLLTVDVTKASVDVDGDSVTVPLPLVCGRCVGRHFRGQGARGHLHLQRSAPRVEVTPVADGLEGSVDHRRSADHNTPPRAPWSLRCCLNALAPTPTSGARSSKLLLTPTAMPVSMRYRWQLNGKDSGHTERSSLVTHVEG